MTLLKSRRIALLTVILIQIAATIERDNRIADMLANETQAVNTLIADLKKAHVRKAVSELVKQDEEAALEGFALAVGSMSIDTRQTMLKKLIAGMSQTWARQVTRCGRPGMSDMRASDAISTHDLES